MFASERVDQLVFCTILFVNCVYVLYQPMQNFDNIMV
jgi:hypothetical protein